MGANSSNSLSLLEVIKTVFNALLAEGMHTSLPGKIEKYDGKTHKATVLPQLKKKYLDGTTLEPRPIEEVPVVHYGANQAGLRLPESEFINQTVLIIFSERALDFWLNKGSLTEPGSSRKFDMTDAIAIIGLNSFNNEDEEAGNNLEIYYKEAVFRLKPDNSIEIGVDTFLKLINENFQSLYNNHGHDYLVSGSPFITSKPTTAVIEAAIPAKIDNSHMTSKVKAE